MKHVYWIYLAVAFAIGVFAMTKLFAALVTLGALATATYLLSKVKSYGSSTNQST